MLNIGLLFPKFKNVGVNPVSRWPLSWNTLHKDAVGVFMTPTVKAKVQFVQKKEKELLTLDLVSIREKSFSWFNSKESTVFVMTKHNG